jgi:hypothetical protein
VYAEDEKAAEDAARMQQPDLITTVGSHAYDFAFEVSKGAVSYKLDADEAAYLRTTLRTLPRVTLHKEMLEVFKAGETAFNLELLEMPARESHSYYQDKLRIYREELTMRTNTFGINSDV